MNILELNDYCLLQIFDYLQPIDKYRVWLTCDQFAYILRSWIHKQVIPLRDAWMKASWSEARRAFSYHAKEIRCMEVKLSNIKTLRQCELLLSHCKNLEQLAVTVCGHADGRLRKLPWNSCKGFPVTGFGSDVIDSEFCRAISKCSQLKVLRMRDCKVSLQHLSVLQNLVELNLEGCKELQPEHFVDILKANVNLTKLNVAGCRRLGGIRCPEGTQAKLESLAIATDDNVTYDLQLMKNLQCVKIVCHGSQGAKNVLTALGRICALQLKGLEIDGLNSEIKSISCMQLLSFPNLTSLSLVWINRLDDRLLESIADTCLKLERVAIWDPMWGVAGFGVVSFVRKLKKLRYLNLNHWVGFSSKLYCEIAGVRKNEIISKKPLELVLYPSNSNLLLVEMPTYIKWKKYATITFSTECWDIFSEITFRP